MQDTIEYLLEKMGKLEQEVHYLRESCVGEHVNLGFKLLSKTATVPTKAHPEDAGWDLYADEDATLEYGIPTVIKTNVAFDFPEYYHGFIWDRSSMGKKGIKVHGGMIDSPYRGSVDVVLVFNDSSNLELDKDTDYDGYDKPIYNYRLTRPYYKIKKGDKIAQLVLVKMPVSYLVEKDELSESSRGEKGFGSSGR